MDTTTTNQTKPQNDVPASPSVDQPAGAPHPGEEVAAHASPTDFPSQEINNQKTVNYQTIIQKVGDFHQGLTETNEFLDPTNELSSSDTKQPPFPDHDSVRRVFEIITKDRIVVIDCLDESVTESAVRALSDLYSNDYALRELLFEGRNKQFADSLNLSVFEDPSKLKRIGSGSNYALIARLHSNSQTFFESLRASSHYVSNIRRILKDNEISIICPVECDFIRGLLHASKESDSYETKSTDRIQDCFYHWQIDFLLPCLNDSYSQTEAEYLERKITEQKKIGLWGDGNPEEFYRLIRQFIDQRTLTEEVDKRNQFKGGNVDEFLSKINPVNIAELFPEDPVERAALFVATFFPNLTRPEFSFLMEVLLENRAMTVYCTAEHLDGTEIRKTRIPVERALIELWGERDDSILKKHHLTTVTTKGGRQTIEFANPYIRPALKHHLEDYHGFYVGKQFARIWSVGVIFQLDVPQSVLDNMIALSAQMARTDPDYYGGRHLIDMVVKLRTEQSDFETEISTRLAKLIREMWSYAELRDVVRRFLNTLMRTKNFDVLLDVVLRVTSRLRFTLDFDTLYWIKRLLDQAAKESYERTIRTLFDLAMQSGLRIYEFFDELAGWLPDNGVDVQSYSRSSIDVLRLIAAYSSHSLERLTIGDLGAWPPSYPLFASLRDDADSRRKLRFVLSSIMHPALSRELTNDLHQDLPPGLKDLEMTVDADLLAAEFVEQWFLVLRGTGKDFADPGALQLARMLVEEFKHSLSTKQRRKLLRYWQLKLDAYRAEAAEAKDATRSRRLRQKADIRSLSRLRKEFKAINAND